MLQRWWPALGIAALHWLVTVLLFVVSLGNAMESFERGQQVGTGERLLHALSSLFLFPLGLLPPLADLAGAAAYALLALNSLLWGLLLWAVWQRRR